MTGKSPLMKKLIGKQGELPENLKAEIKAAPEKMKKPSPAKVGEGRAIIKTLSNSSLFDKSSWIPLTKAERKAKEEKENNKTASEKSETGKIKGSGEGSGAETANQNAGKTFQGLQKKIAGGAATSGGDRFSKAYAKRGKEYKAMSLAEYTAEAKRQIANRKKTGKYIGGEVKSEVKKQDGSKVQRSQSEKDFLKQQEADRKAKDDVEPKKSDFTKSQFGKKVINRPGGTFTDEFGNTYNRSVKGRKKADGSVSKTVTNKRNDKVTSQKDVTKGPKVNGRRTKTVTKTKFTGSGTPKVITKTRGPGGRKRTVLGDTEAKSKVAELKKRREARDNSPTKMKKKSPAKNYKKGYYGIK